MPRKIMLDEEMRAKIAEAKVICINSVDVIKAPTLLLEEEVKKSEEPKLVLGPFRCTFKVKARKSIYRNALHEQKQRREATKQHSQFRKQHLKK